MPAAQQDTHVNIHITGKVQGVFFRYSAQQQAFLRNIRGYASNRPDGSVYIEAEGSPDQMKEFLEWCKEGPPRAHVESLTTTQGELKGYATFEIE